MNIKKGDTVKILTGKDKGKSGKVLLSLPKQQSVVIEGLNLIKKHQKPKKSGQKGQIIDRAMPIHVSNVKLKDQKSK